MPSPRGLWPCRTGNRASCILRVNRAPNQHSFAADPARGLFILAFLVIIIGGALALYAWRAPLLRSEAG
ncbi:MAG: hypothetical protein NTX54_03705, partial [Chloroflexi bacterium]|nr:hypothetical protein [Chloroflexota bacterium]